MKYIKLYDNRREFVFDPQRFFPNTSLVNGEEEPSFFTDVEEVVFELTVTLPTEKVVTGETYTLAVEYGGADVFSEATVTTTGDVTLNGTQFTANTDGDFSVTATYDGKTVTLNGTSKLMTAAPTISFDDNGCGIYRIDICGNATKTITFNDEEFTPSQNSTINFKYFYADLIAQTVVVTATAQETGKWESDAATATYTIPVLQTLTASISDNTLEDGETAQMTVMYGNKNVTEHIGIMYTASGDVTCTNGNVMHQGAGVVTAAYSTGSGSIVVSSNGGYGNPNLTPITINVTVAEPAHNIVFADNDVKAIVTNAYGSDGEITEEQAAAVTTWFSGADSSTNPFYGNTDINSFDEFRYFTGVTEIGAAAFMNCRNMTSIIIPSSVTSIGNNAVRGCDSLTRIICEATVPPTLGGSNVFFQTRCRFYVPEESVESYKAAQNWSIYAYRIQPFGVTVSLSSESIVTGYKYNLNVTYNGGDVLSNATITSTGDVTINGSGFTANSDGAFSITATYNGYTATLNGTASTPQYAVVALDCSELEDANPFDHYGNEAQSNAEHLGLDLGEDTYVENGVITIPPEDDFCGIAVAVPDPAYDGCIGYIKLTHPSAEYKLNEETISSVGEGAGYTCDVSFDSTTLTTTFSNFVSEDQESPFTGTLALANCGSTDIKITRIEVAFIPAEEEPAEEEPAEEEE